MKFIKKKLSNFHYLILKDFEITFIISIHLHTMREISKSSIILNQLHCLNYIEITLQVFLKFKKSSF